MRVAGIDVGSERHHVAVVGEEGEVRLGATGFDESGAGYDRLFTLLKEHGPQLVVMEATGHYWLNLYGALIEHRYPVAVINPLRGRRYAEEELARSKSDHIDCVQLARFGLEKRPAPTVLGDELDQELREMVRQRAQFMEDRTRQLNRLARLVDLGFPELTRFIPDLSSRRALTLLKKYPTARAVAPLKMHKLARLKYDGRHQLGEELAAQLIETARRSVGSQHSQTHREGVRFACEDIELLERRLAELNREIAARVRAHKLGSLLTTIDGIGSGTAACLVAEIGNPARFPSAAHLASYLGLVPAHRSSGKRQPSSAPLTAFGNRRVRNALWMPTLGAATKHNRWLMAFYQRLVENGKPRKVALIAAMRKLVTAIYAVAKHQRPFVPILAGAQAAATLEVSP